MPQVEVPELPDDPLEAAATFHGDVLSRISALLAGASESDCLTLVFPLAGHSHRAWRLAAVQSLARKYAPARVNAVAGEDKRAIAAAVRFCDSAPGVTGQYFPLDGNGAGPVLDRTE